MEAIKGHSQGCFRGVLCVETIEQTVGGGFARRGGCVDYTSLNGRSSAA